MTKILVVGDSYTNGQGCSDISKDPEDLSPSNLCWAALLQKKIAGSTVKNLAMPGLDNVTIARLVWDNVDPTIDAIVFCASFISRIQVKHYDVDGITASILADFKHSNSQEFKEYNSAVNNYYRYLYNDRVGENISVASLMSAYACARQINARFYWSFSHYHEIANNPALKLIENHRFTSCSDFDYKKSELAPCRHPNDAGHLRYFQEVIDPLF
jgi:hypothetical protein